MNSTHVLISKLISTSELTPEEIVFARDVLIVNNDGYGYVPQSWLESHRKCKATGTNIITELKVVNDATELQLLLKVNKEVQKIELETLQMKLENMRKLCNDALKFINSQPQWEHDNLMEILEASIEASYA